MRIACVAKEETETRLAKIKLVQVSRLKENLFTESAGK